MGLAQIGIGTLTAFSLVYGAASWQAKQDLDTFASVAQLHADSMLERACMRVARDSAKRSWASFSVGQAANIRRQLDTGNAHVYARGFADNPLRYALDPNYRSTVLSRTTSEFLLETTSGPNPIGWNAGTFNGLEDEDPGVQILCGVHIEERI